MDIESKIWTPSNTGTKLHAMLFGVAICRSTIRRAPETVEKWGRDYCEAKATLGYSICTTCETKFNAAIERAEAAMQPSTGEGDYLPPAIEEEDSVTETKRAVVKPKITPEVIEALRVLRAATDLPGLTALALDVLDNAGVFAAIDEATGYDVDPTPERVSKCTCPAAPRKGWDHFTGCPGDPAEWGDLAYTTKEN